MVAIGTRQRCPLLRDPLFIGVTAFVVWCSFVGGHNGGEWPGLGSQVMAEEAPATSHKYRLPQTESPSQAVSSTPQQDGAQDKTGKENDDKAASQEQSSATKSEDSKTEHKYPANHLANETSPYLLAHAHNPVNWYPWGPEAFNKAKKENKIIFLSIGYSSCHWCHVMERESFMDEEIAELLNENFVCIKVDREERPDIDTVYMASLRAYHQLIQSERSGGWPLNVFLLPDQRPFFGGTYFPPRDGVRGARVGFLSIIRNVSRIWRENPERIKSDARQVARLARRFLQNRWRGGREELRFRLVEQCVEQLARQFDPIYGGFGFNSQRPDRPKFPQSPKLLFLIDFLQQKTSDERSANMLSTTLDNMMIGGIRDHLGGGFHRYSVDRYWQIPHFEKMLYDNAQLTSIYARAAGILEREIYLDVAVDTADFVLRRMQSPEGGFWSALDADTEGVEGKYYRWTQDEIESALDGEQLALAKRAFGLNAEPNFEDEYYVIQFTEPLEDIAAELSINEQTLIDRLREVQNRLLERRQQRESPPVDHKVLTGWNGLMIRGLVDLHEALVKADRADEAEKYLNAAVRSAELIFNKLRPTEESLLRSYSKGEASIKAYLDDYAYLIDGLLALHSATGDKRWLERAQRLQAEQDSKFWDEEHGGYFYTSTEHEQLLARMKKPMDNEVPSGLSVSATNLLGLAKSTGDQSYRSRAVDTVYAAEQLARERPTACPRLIGAIRRLAAKANKTAK